MKKSTALIILSVFLLILPLEAVLAVGEAAYDLSWWSVDGGGGLSSGGDFTLRSVIGQSDTSQSASGQYVVTGGFLSIERQPEPVPFLQIILPFIFKESTIK